MDDFWWEVQQPQEKAVVFDADKQHSTNPLVATQPVVYAEVKWPTNPPAAPPPTQPVVYADIQQSTNPPVAPPPTQPVVYANIQQSTSPPAAPPPNQEVLYSEVKDFLILNVVTVHLLVCVLDNF